MAGESPHIPDHELLRRIGKGAYGEVWLARNLTGAYRAVKVVFRDSFDHERPYEREFSGIQKFEPVSRTHETQVGILHVGRNDAEGYFFYIMELADDRLTGQEIDPDRYEPWTLRSHLFQNGRVPAGECLDIAIHLAAALQHIHENGLVHRDVKPSNVIFIKRVPKLADIGLVTTTDAARSFVGTEGYIPPEGPGSPRADIYSLGRVLYEISTGRNRLDFPELPTLLMDLPDREALVQFNEVVLKACEEDPAHRYQSADAMLADLWKLKSGEPIRRIRPQPARRRLQLALSIGIACAMLMFGAGWRIFGVRHGAAKPLKPRQEAAAADSAAPGESVPTEEDVIYQTHFAPGAYRPGPLAGQDGWTLWPIDGGSSGEAAKVVQSDAGQSLLITGFNLESSSPAGYRLDCARPLPSDRRLPHARRITLSADLELSIDPDAPKLDWHAVGFGLVLPDGSVTNEMWFEGRGRVYVDLDAPGYHKQGSDGFPTKGFHRITLDCDLELRRAIWSLDGHMFSDLPFIANCTGDGAFPYFHFSASGPNATTLTVSNLVVTAAADWGVPARSTGGGLQSGNPAAIVGEDAPSPASPGPQSAGPASLPAVLKQGLILWYSFGSAPTNGMIPDRSGAKNDGKAEGVRWTPTEPGGALALAPVDSHVRVRNTASLNPGRFTVSTWVKTSRADHFYRRIIDKGLFHNGFDVTVDGDYARFNPATRYRGFVEFEITDTGVVRSLHSVADGDWHQVVASYDGKEKRLFIDGQLQGTVVAANARVANSLDLMIGGFVDPDPEYDDPHASLDGSVAEVMMFDRALSSTEVWQLFEFQANHVK